MYWIYLIIFILMVFSPDIIRNNWYFIEEERMEQLLILFLGVIVFLIFLWNEKQLKINLEKRIKIQKEAKEISRDLATTYNYIGEINRKLEILKEISFCLPETSFIVPAKEKEIFGSIFNAIQLFSKADYFIIRFINKKSGDVLREIKNHKHIPFSIDNGYWNNMKNNFLETEKYFVVKSTRDIDNIESNIIIYKKNYLHKIKNLEEFRILANKTLSIFAYSMIKNNSNRQS